ncbi:MAG: 2-amino-4-hydroxy-6-hydroxymethyldihydropteridine pyrophosphokinae [Bacilli bacterium]|nr:2-amino-4-hydroxy-6-hydroxymethyldihydropteridine pyrophosphokinae [Bacilli bacterium]
MLSNLDIMCIRDVTQLAALGADPGFAIDAIALGANLGDRLLTIQSAVKDLTALTGMSLQKYSSIWETEPVGYLNQPKFLNAVILVTTSLRPAELLEFLLKIESNYLRVRTIKEGPRTLDLDLLYMDNEVISDKWLTLPHPRLHERAFVLAPLQEVAPEWHHPVLGLTVKEMWEQLSDREGIQQCKRTLVEK